MQDSVKMKGVLFVISAPSGGGKSSIVRGAKERIKDLGYSVSHTSRPPRRGEKEGLDYHFVDKETFSVMVEAGRFVEWACVYGDFYGTSFESFEIQIDSGLDVILDLDVQGALNVKERFRNSILIYVLPPSLQVLEQRLRDRGTDPEPVILERLRQAPEEIRASSRYDYIIINDRLEVAVGETESVIRSERCRTERQLPRVKRIFRI